jgi:hypothetical protein
LEPPPRWEEFASFLPIEGTSKIIDYTGVPVSQAVITASILGVTGDDDEVNFATLVNARLELVDQDIPIPSKIPGKPITQRVRCIIIRGVVGGRGAKIHGLTYQVTALSKPTITSSLERIGTIIDDLPPFEVPRNHGPEITVSVIRGYS